MRTTLTLLSLGCIGTSMSQPVLEYANVALLGKTYPLHLVTDPGSSDPNIDGANVTWDFSSATLQLNLGSCTFVDPTTTPQGSSYPAANLAQAVTTPLETTYNYFELTTTQLNMLAEDVGGADETIYTDPKTPLEFPFSYPNYFIDYFTYDGTNYSVSRAYMGYGTVILPTGTYTNVVKMASTSGAIDFFRSNPVEPLVQITDDGTVIVWGDGSTGVEEERNAVDLVAVPNPAVSSIMLQGITTQGTWSLLDAQGRMQREGRHAPGTLSIDLEGLALGAYTLQLRDALGVRTVQVVKN